MGQAFVRVEAWLLFRMMTSVGSCIILAFMAAFIDARVLERSGSRREGAPRRVIAPHGRSFATAISWSRVGSSCFTLLALVETLARVLLSLTMVDVRRVAYSCSGKHTSQLFSNAVLSQAAIAQQGSSQGELLTGPNSDRSGTASRCHQIIETSTTGRFGKVRMPEMIMNRWRGSRCSMRRLSDLHRVVHWVYFPHPEEQSAADGRAGR